jgi:hypothetical protein
MDINTIPTEWIIVLVVVAILELVLKGFALWRAGRSNDLVWFVILLVINTAGILPAVYLLMHRGAVKQQK